MWQGRAVRGRLHFEFRPEPLQERSELSCPVKGRRFRAGERMEVSTMEREKVKNVSLSLLSMIHISGSAQELQAWFSEQTCLSPNLPTTCNPLEMQSQILHLGT